MYFNGLGHYLPDTIIHNEQLEKQLSLPSGWIVSRTGIESRHYANDQQSLVDMAKMAACRALQGSTANQQEIGMVILATSTPDHLLPPSAPLLAHQLGLSHCVAFDIAGACNGFLNALMLADSYVRYHQRSVLIVAANILSRRINFSECDSAILFGDGAGAVVISPSSNTVIRSDFMTAGDHYSFIKIKSGGSVSPFNEKTILSDTKISLQQGKSVFKHAIKLMTMTCKNICDDDVIHDLNYFIPHQSNLRIMQQVCQQLSIISTKMISTLKTIGNTSAAGIPISLSIAHQACRFKDGDQLLLTAAGAGMSGGAVWLRL